MLYWFTQPKTTIITEPPPMMMIPLPNSPTMACVDPDDYDRVRKHAWKARRFGKHTYVVTRIDGKYVRLNRFVLGLTPGDGLSVVPENGSYFDCRKANLTKVASATDPTKSWDSRRAKQATTWIAPPNGAGGCPHPVLLADPGDPGRYVCVRCDGWTRLTPTKPEKDQMLYK